MRCCLQLSHHSFIGGDPTGKVDRTLATIREADRLGFDSVWLTEDPDGWDAFAVLGAAARETDRIRLGTGVTNPYLRHPNLIAASVSTIDRLSGGRAFLGLGRGQPEWYRTALGLEVASPLKALESTIDLLHQWWKPPYRASGHEPYPVNGWERTIAPLGLTVPPIYLAATGTKALQLAGRAADGVRFNEMASTHFLTEAIATFTSAAIQAGRDPSDLPIFVHPGIVITDEPEAALEKKKAMIATIYTLPGMERQLETPGIDVHSIMNEVRRLMRTDDILARGGGFPDLRRGGDLESAKRVIPLELMDRVAIVGSIAAVRSRLAGIAKLGATHFFLDLGRIASDGLSPEEVIAQLSLESL